MTFYVDHLLQTLSIPLDRPMITEAYTQNKFYTGDSVHESDKEMVNSPDHYNTGKIECIDAMQAMLSHEEFVGFLRGNAFKYMWRFRNKGNAEQDLAKANWYTNRLNLIFNSK